MGEIPVIAGPTGVGKTALAIELARRLGAEVISADSRQVYKELTIGAAKPTSAELAAVPHHFINELTLDEPFSAGLFAESASARIESIELRKRRVVAVGGSTLYVHALVYGLADIPDVTPAVTLRTNDELRQHGSAWLHEELRRVDPEAAQRIDATKSHRIVRALSVYRSTGRRLASFYTSTARDERFRLFLLDRDRAELYARIDRRVDEMIAAGLVDEARAIADKGTDLTLPALRTIGYSELFDCFNPSGIDGSGTIGGDVDHGDIDEAVVLIKRNSRRYAKRQLTWFRRYAEATFLDATRSVEQLADQVLAELDTV